MKRTEKKQNCVARCSGGGRGVIMQRHLQFNLPYVYSCKNVCSRMYVLCFSSNRTR